MDGKFLLKSFRIVVLLLPFWIWPLADADLVMRVFKVGQGNFILLTKDDKALVVDCVRALNIDESYTKEIDTALDGLARHRFENDY
ncbi:MAG: hypothetical protein LBI37_00745 [Puniceicoccales bacterium]|jgi:hypothetical protein|nr:hypothetical protein [Puniceicoccales bacterium]